MTILSALKYEHILLPNTINISIKLQEIVSPNKSIKKSKTIDLIVPILPPIEGLKS